MFICPYVGTIPLAMHTASMLLYCSITRQEETYPNSCSFVGVGIIHEAGYREEGGKLSRKCVEGRGNKLLHPRDLIRDASDQNFIRQRISSTCCWENSISHYYDDGDLGHKEKSYQVIHPPPLCVKESTYLIVCSQWECELEYHQDSAKLHSVMLLFALH